MCWRQLRRSRFDSVFSIFMNDMRISTHSAPCQDLFCAPSWEMEKVERCRAFLIFFFEFFEFFAIICWFNQITWTTFLNFAPLTWPWHQHFLFKYEVELGRFDYRERWEIKSFFTAKWSEFAQLFGLWAVLKVWSLPVAASESNSNLSTWTPSRYHLYISLPIISKRKPSKKLHMQSRLSNWSLYAIQAGLLASLQLRGSEILIGGSNWVQTPFATRSECRKTKIGS